jgi:molybdopterin-guanine dinucleotide biosynthesis protein A
VGRKLRPATLAILAGGRSTRLGRAKAFEEFGGASLLEMVIRRLSVFDYPILIVTSQSQYGRISEYFPERTIVLDLYPGTGVIGAVYTALLTANTNRVFVTACDMPFLNTALIGSLIAMSACYDAVVPDSGGMQEPLHAVYSKSCLKPLERLIKQDRLCILDLFDTVNTCRVAEDEIDRLDPGHKSFININTEEDLDNARAGLCNVRLRNSDNGIGVLTTPNFH